MTEPTTPTAFSALGPRDLPAEPMPHGRRVFATVVIAVLVLGHVAAVVDDDEHWPFSPYRLYAKLYEHGARNELVLYGVEADGGEVRLSDDHFQPMDEGRLRRVLGEQFAAGPDGRRTFGAFGPWLAFYERGRERGRHDGPPLVGIRLHQEVRFFDAQARNRTGPPDQAWYEGEYFPPGVAPTPVPASVGIRGDVPPPAAGFAPGGPARREEHAPTLTTEGGLDD